MKVIIDGDIYSSAPDGGVYNYLNELIPRLRRVSGLELELLLSKTAQVPPQIRGEIAIQRDPLPSGRWIPSGTVRTFLSKTKKLVNGAILNAKNLKAKNVVYHSPYYTLPSWNNMPVVADFHDAISEIFPEFRDLPHNISLTQRKTLALSRATRVIATSHQTKRDLVNTFGFPENKVDVVYRGVNLNEFGMPPSPERRSFIQNKFGLHAPFILYIGGRLHHKNFSRFLEACAIGKWKTEYPIAVVGRPWTAEETALIRRLGLENHVNLLNGVDDLMLKDIYTLAKVFVFPSLYEGFGLPIVEAFASGTPVAAARAGSLAEIGEGGALFFDPKDPADMEKAIATLISPDTARLYREKGKLRAKSFSWDVAAAETLKVYQKAIEEF